MVIQSSSYKKKRRRKRKRNTKAKSSAQCEHASAKTTAELQPSLTTPTSAHLSPENEAKQTSTSTQVNVEEGIDLNSCSNVRYDKRGTVHGVTYSIGDEEGWTPVIGKRAKRSAPRHVLRLRAPHVKDASPPTSCDSDDSNCSDLVIPDHANVNFSIVDGKPGLHVSTRCTRSWTPIASRTRAKLKS